MLSLLSGLSELVQVARKELHVFIGSRSGGLEVRVVLCGQVFRGEKEVDLAVGRVSAPCARSSNAVVRSDVLSHFGFDRLTLLGNFHRLLRARLLLVRRDFERSLMGTSSFPSPTLIFTVSAVVSNLTVIFRLSRPSARQLSHRLPHPLAFQRRFRLPSLQQE